MACRSATVGVAVAKATAGNLGLKRARRLERETGFEPATSTLARSHSTTELFPPAQNR